MTKDNARDYLPLVQALAEGKVIQINTGSERGWHDFQCDVSFDLPPNHYRIKPEPRVWWVNECKNGKGEPVYIFCNSSKEARKASYALLEKMHTFKVVEVME